jgi:fructose-bisphosphate aldolase, class I
VLKPNIVLSGYDCPRQAGVAEVAGRTLGLLRRVVPAAAWGGNESNAEAAQDALAHRARCNSEARLGRYTDALEQALAA